MKQKALIIAAVLFTALSGFGIGFAHGQQPSEPVPQSAQAPGPQSDVPAYHATPATESLPDTLDPKQFADARTQRIYALAAKVKPVLYQQPCYCRCDREVGHTSLLDCFRDNHGSICDVCKKEAAYSYQQTKLGKTPAEIRAGIMAGKWKQVDLTKYDAAAVAPAPPVAK
ncbi:MAG: CYCXC family (seleno)protein [Candidatus Acidiferrales bacterium]